MSTNHARLPQRRAAGQRVKADENAMSRHARHASNTGVAAGGRFAAKDLAVATKPTNAVRQALGEVTMAINRKDIGVQRVPLGPGRTAPSANTANSRIPSARPKIPNAVSASSRLSRSSVSEQTLYASQAHHYEDDVVLDAHESEVEAMVGLDDEEEVELVDDLPAETPESKPARVWPEVSTSLAARFREEVDAVREHFEDEVDMYDTTMVSEYADEIFQYMEELEDDVMPNPDYMEGQNEITWAMRQTLVDWLLQVHLRYHMLPETLWIAVNIVDRFLTKRVVSLVKLQLVGVTAMFVAAKYEEILAPSVEEFVFMTEKGYTKEEILKGERIMLQTLEFRISHYCSPYSWMRKISKADDYDIQTRTLSKFLTEVTLLDYRFLRVKPSLVAAVGMYCSRRMLGGDWNEAFVYYSGYTEEQLMPGFRMMLEKLAEEGFSKQYVCKKYANKKFLKASVFAIEWAISHLSSSDSHEMMVSE
ncbi:cyclin [Ephemerocybe angulata]|uniref:Cyclin n=1 Tax=Ephemerocybe angulata TaxID=980116 RepID=A0A8H6I4K8_9AGAR|nr:cyclin [Tulosesus angulatus]